MCIRDRIAGRAANGSELSAFYWKDTGTMNVYIDREMLKNTKVLKGFTDQPNLMNMTKKSLDILSKLSLIHICQCGFSFS